MRRWFLELFLQAVNTLISRFLFLLVRYIIWNLYQRLPRSMVDFVSSNGVLQEVRVVREISRAMLAQIRPGVGVDVGVLLKFRR